MIMKKAFTLLEILIVMTIIGLLIAIGTGGLLVLRENTEAEQATNEVLALLKETQTKAKNNTIPFSHNEDPAQFAAAKNRNYAFIITSATVDGRLILQRRICWKPITTPETSWNSIALTTTNCTTTDDLIPPRFQNIELENAGTYGVPVNPACPLTPPSAIVFENLTGKIFSKTDSSESPLNCRFALRIDSQNVNYSFIDFFQNNFTRAYPNN